jgi:uncharacterized protein YegL
MSFLYPLFLAGIAAIGVPILLHLIRRQTRKRVTFSSLMFLRTTMPRFKSRSHLENLLLLILRCMIVCLLAFAFARPFFPRDIEGNPVHRARRVVLLVDTSGSMRRAGMWAQAVSQAVSALKSASPTDRVCVMSFDQSTKTLMGFEQWAELEPARRVSVVTEEISKLSPDWASTDLGHALVTAAETIEDDEVNDAQQSVWTHEVVLISDLQQGAALDALQAYQWPEHTKLTVKLIQAKGTTNATLQLTASRDDLSRPSGQNLSAIRVTNSPDATSERFNLKWTDETSAQVKEVYVPAGRSVVVRVPMPTEDKTGHRLVLTGDDHDFDNTLYVAPHPPRKIDILYIGSDDANDVQGMLYYARRAFAATGAIEPHLTCRSPQTITEADVAKARLIIAADTVEPLRCASLRGYLNSGGTLLLVIKSPDAARTIAALAGIDNVKAKEAAVDGYAMLSQIDFEHPVLAPFSDPRFGDFTRIHFWKHRDIDLANLPGAEMLARYDDGRPAWFELAVGKGSLLVLTSGWQPSDSQLALSSKFVPLLYSVLEYSGALTGRRSQYFVGQPVTIAQPRGREMSRLQIRRPDGAFVQLEGGQKTFTQTDVPGIYSVDAEAAPASNRGRDASDTARFFAVNLPPKESQTAVMAIENIENYGVSAGTALPGRQNEDNAGNGSERRRRVASASALEQEQKLWRWVLVLLLAVSFVEIALAGRLTRASYGPQPSAE